uniref:Uncharacterized protein n=1 Tax=Setaria viridis TaxID=4556 RepID=A0A4U6TVM5_SETVI|nr:hypothetical protein SEVIR_7G187700v2 [Setaria viridis]
MNGSTDGATPTNAITAYSMDTEGTHAEWRVGQRVSDSVHQRRHPDGGEASSQAPWNMIPSDASKSIAPAMWGQHCSGDGGEEVVAGAAAAEEVVGRPERVERARPAGVQAQPRLPLPAPVQQADRARVQLPALPRHVVAAEPVLVPPVLHGLHLAGEHQEERREGAQLVYPGLLLLHLHPVLQLPGVPAGAPPVQVDDHDPGVEVAGDARPVGEDGGVLGVSPERVGEVGGEVGVAVLGRGEGGVGAEVGVEVEDAGDGAREEVGEVDAGVVEGLVERAADGGGDLAPDESGVEAVHGGGERGEGGRQRAAERSEAPRRGRRGCDEVEGDGLRAGGVAEHGEDAGEGATQVGGVQRHRDVDRRRARAGRAVAERRRLPELRQLPAAAPGSHRRRRRRRTRRGEEDRGEDAHCGPGASFRLAPPP